MGLKLLSDDKMLIRVKVKPNSKEERVEKISDNEYKIDIKEPAENNRANIRVINIMAKELGVSYKNIKIKNPASRNKVIEVKE